MALQNNDKIKSCSRKRNVNPVLSTFSIQVSLRFLNKEENKLAKASITVKIEGKSVIYILFTQQQGRNKSRRASIIIKRQ
jgi:hypothetical protein